jgi:hypothetical protein
MKITFSIIISFFLFADTTFTQNETRLEADVDYGNPGDGFGLSISMQGDYLMVGTPYDDFYYPYQPFAMDVGSVTIFERELVGWKVNNIISGPSPGAHFGSAVSISGDYACIGVPKMLAGLAASAFPENAGQVCILRKEDNNWIIDTWLEPSGDDIVIGFGSSLSIYEDYAVVGTYDGDTPSPPGTAYIFKLEGENWIQQETLYSGEPNGNDNFGRSVAIFGDYILVGADGIKSNNYNYPGTVFVYRLLETGWDEEIRLIPQDAEARDGFGFSVAISNDFIAVSSPNDNIDVGVYGSVYIYYNDGSSWLEHQKLIAPDGNLGDGFGRSVYINEDVLIIGAPYAYGDHSYTGAVYLYKRVDNDWIFQSKILASDGVANDGFGSSVALDNSTCAIGAPEDDNFIGHNAGSVYVFKGITTPYLSLPQVFDFGKAFITKTENINLQIKNEGLVDLNISAISITGTDATSFNSEQATFSVAPGTTYNLNVSFTPNEIRQYVASLNISSNGGYKSVTLIGNGSPLFSITPEELQFGNTSVGDNPKKNISIQNVDVTSITVDSIIIKSVAPVYNVFTTNVTTPFQLNPDEILNSEIEFRPYDILEFNSKLIVYSSNGSDSISLYGKGFYAGFLKIDKDTVNFGTVMTGKSGYDSVIVSNNGGYSLHVDSILINGIGNFMAGPVSFSINPGSHRKIGLTFFPNTDGVFEGVLDIYSTGGDAQVRLIGTGQDAGILDVTPDTLFFNNMPVGQKLTEQLLIANWGYVDLHIIALSISGSNSSNFSSTLDPITISPGGIKRLSINFIPNAVGIYLAELSLISDGGNIIVPLVGEGISCSPFLKTEVVPDDASNFHLFGNSVAVSGFNAIIGASPMDQSGAAYIFRCNGSGWSQNAKLLPVNTGIYDGSFGTSVDISNHVAIVGAPAHNDSGAAYIFNYQGFLGGWNLVDTLFADISSPTKRDEFGLSVAIDDNIAIIGAPKAFINPNTSAGIVYIFKAPNYVTGPKWYLLDRLTAFDGSVNHRFGYSVDVSGDFAIVGTVNNGAYIYQSIGGDFSTDWFFRGKLLSSDYNQNDHFGSPVSISGNIAMVGAPFNDLKGAVYIFERVGGVWIETAKITSPDPIDYGSFGQSISLSGHSALIGTSQQGKVYLFERQNSNNWDLITTIKDNGIDHNNGFGDCVGLDANSAVGIIGIRSDYYNNMFSGSADIYSGLAVSSTQIEDLIIPKEFKLIQNYPNPFNPVTTIKFDIPTKSKVVLKIYNILGEDVITLVNEEKLAGNYEVNFDASRFSSGVYFYQLNAGEYLETKKMILLK